LSWLLDTVTLSELRKDNRNPGVARWFDDHIDDALFVACVTFGEIERGIVRARSSDPAFAMRLELWLNRVIVDFGDRALPFTTPVAIQWGRLSAHLNRFDADLEIAATALVHNLTVVTRNVRHFEPTGVRVVNPWEAN